MHDLCAKWEDEEGYHFSLYSTPAESLTDTFCQDDLKKFGRVANVTDKEYYTNSFHYDVRKHPTPFEKLEFEEDFPYQAAVALSTTVSTQTCGKTRRPWKPFGTGPMTTWAT
jgi:Oxygen-sensitive ribonucleoside-triphosphate reductase